MASRTHSAWDHEVTHDCPGHGRAHSIISLPSGSPTKILIWGVPHNWIELSTIRQLGKGGLGLVAWLTVRGLRYAGTGKRAPPWRAPLDNRVASRPVRMPQRILVAWRLDNTEPVCHNRGLWDNLSVAERMLMIGDNPRIIRGSYLSASWRETRDGQQFKSNTPCSPSQSRPRQGQRITGRSAASLPTTEC